ncbi:uncharacterized protein METZ01_LOCUS191543, partial [marine metagenome]
MLADSVVQGQRRARVRLKEDDDLAIFK